MDLENVQSACAMLKSSKVTDRKRSAEDLMELLGDDDICRNLDSNSVQRDRSGDKVTWTSLFKEVTEYFSKETEKLTVNQAGSITKSYSFSVVDCVFQKGTCRRPWINWSNILNFTTEYLSREVHATVYGSALVSMLQNFLSIELYVSVIDASAWNDLIKLLIKLYAHRKYNIPPVKILECVYLCIQEGSNHPIVIASLRSDMVQFYENIFTIDKIGSRAYLSVILRGITSLCRKNAVEFRGALCKLGESLIPKILNSSNYTTDEEGAIVELLLVQVQIHSPCDTSFQNSAFYAHDSRKWTEIVRLIYQFCLEALEDIATKKQKNTNNKELQVSDRLLLLAAKCTKLVSVGSSNEHSSSGDEDDPNPAKKPMRFRSFQNVLNDICTRMTPGESQIVWMNYLTAVFTQFPLLVDTRINFSSLFQVGTTLLKSTFITRRDVYLFFLCLLNTEKSLIEKEVLKCRSKNWENVWDLTIRSLSVSEFKTEALELLRKILIEVQPSNVHSLLLLYTSGAIPVTPASLNLLAENLSRCSLPLYIGSSPSETVGYSTSLAIDVEIASTSCPRSALIRWLMNSSTATGKPSNPAGSSAEQEFQDLGLGHEPLIATILCSLLVRQTHNLIVSEKFCFRPNSRMRFRIPSELTQFETVYEDFEKMLLKCCFVPLPPSSAPSIEEHNENSFGAGSEPPEILKLSLIPTIPGRFVESLMEDYDNMPQFDHNSSDFLKRFTQLNYRVALYLNSLNVLEKYTIGTRGGDDFGFRTSLEKLFDKAMCRLVECTTDFITKGKSKSAAQVQELIVIVRNILKSYHLCDGVKAMLAQRFPQHLQELLKKAYRSNLVRYIEKAANNPSDTLMFGSHDIAARFISAGNDDCRHIELAALESLGCLVDYGVICDHRVDLFSDILRDCITETYNSNIPFIFEFSSELIARLIPPLNSSRGREYTDVLTLVTNLLQKMCKGFYTVPQCSARLWELFSDITALTARDTDVNKKNLMILIGTLSGFMKTKTPHGSSILVCQAGFKGLNELAKNDPQMEWSVFTPKSGPDIWVLNATYEFLNNPSHQIRLFATETICATYESAAPLIAEQPNYVARISSRPLSLAEYFEQIYQFIQTTFAISPNLTQDENAEEAVNRTSIALACLARLVFGYPFIQKRMLFSLLQLVKTKSLEIPLTYRALVYTSPTAAKTMCCHVSFLLHKWLTSDYPIDEFPYQFFGVESMSHFYNEFRKEISVEFFQKNDTEGLAKFATFFKMDPLDMIKECFGMLMARIVPGVAIYKSTNQSSAGRDIAQLQELQEIQKRLTSTLGGKSQTESLMMTRLDDVVMQSVSLVFDPNIPSEWGCPSSFKLPEPSTPYYDENSVDTGFNFLKDASSRKDFSLIAILALHNAKAIYDTLLKLIKRVHDSHDSLEKFWRLHQFSYFLKQLLREKPQIFSKMKEYVCQFVVFGYIRLLNGENGNGDYSKYFRESLVHLISQLVLTLTITYPEEMKEHYYTVVNNLVVSVVKHPHLLEAAKKPLDTLLIRYEKEFADCIVTLDPFPTNKVGEFEKYKDVYLRVKYGQGTKPGCPVRGEWNLFQELKSYLQNRAESWTLERLQWIRELLNQKKRDVDKLVKQMEGKRLSDMGQSEVLHALIQILLNVIKNGEDEDLVLEAARCLGEIGPVDLSVLVLPNQNRSKRVIKGMARSLITIVEILVDYLKSDDINLVTTSGKVLQALCRTSECTGFIEKNFAKTRTEVILKPFRLGQDETPIPKTAEKVFPNAIETKLGLNEMNEFVDYNNWIIKLTCGLIECFKEENSVIASLLAVCRIKVEFCEEILPFVFYVLLYSGRANPLVRKTVSGYFRNFFNKCIHNLSGSSDCSRSFTPVMGSQHQQSIFTNKLALRSLIGVIQFLRLHPAPQEYKGSSKIIPWDSNFWLDISYFDLAKAAQHCGAYLTSILFTEIAVTEVDTGLNSHVEDNGEEDMEAFYSQGNLLLPPRGIRGVHSSQSYELLLKAYTNIGEPDAVYGCGSARFSDGMMNISHLQQRLQFFRVLSASDGNPVDSNSPTKAGVAGALKDLALYNSLWVYLKGVEMEDKMLDHDLAEIQYECGWRLSKWNLNCDKATYLKDGSFFENSRSHGMLQRFVYESVQTGLAKDVVNHVQNVARGYKSVSRNLRHASIESSENLYGFLSQFQMLRVVEDFFEEEGKSGSLGIDNFLQRWRTHDKISPADFKFQEPVLSLRCVLLHSYDQRNPSSRLETAYDDSMLEILSKARDCGRLEFAENCANSISAMSDRSLKRDLEIAKNHWARGDQDIARHILGKLIKKNPDGCDLYPNMLLLHGEWLSESMSERPAVILEKYLLRSCQIFEKRGATGQSDGAKAQFVLAKYADDQYQNVVKYMKSELYSEKIAHLEKARLDLAAVAKIGGLDVDVRRSANTLKKQSDNDRDEINAIIAEKKKFLLLALRHYLKGLKDSNDQDLLVFRAVALWLENADSGDDIKFSTDVNKTVKTEVLPSYKYVVVLHQLSARLSASSTSSSSDMASNISVILSKCAEQHPYHTLPVLLTQSLLHQDQVITTGKGAAKKKQQTEDRVAAAHKLVDGLQRHKTLGDLTRKMGRLWEALIQLANVQETKNVSSPVLIPNNSDIKKLIGLENVPIPTATLSVSPSGEYGDIVGISSFEPTYGLVGGINSPKRITCIGTNGCKFNMLLKGQDDLRQDAVMQQVFSVMNKLLQNEPKTKSRKLHVRTYKVVPLSQRTGVLEWCENTQTFGDYLIGSKDNDGGHQKYRPTDYNPMECRIKMSEVKECGDNEKKYSTFMAILEHFKPVFRHFFFENFKEAGAYFERRLAYTRSVATNSMVGYVLGLGDRHVLNILVDKTTAELIHIDLGVAFEQGRILPSPETIPFRLTRDIVDGMGVSGVEGVYRKSCEMTLDVLRSNSEIILTILEVLLYDPLYMWTLTADRVRKVQPTDSNQTPLRKRGSATPIAQSSIVNETGDDAPKARNNSAARVLLRLRQKLAGVEEEVGTSASALSVPGHVSLLIQRAMDPEKLSRLFPGWQPYL